MRPTTTDRDWTLSAPTLSPAEMDTALSRALGEELAPDSGDVDVEAPTERPAPIEVVCARCGCHARERFTGYCPSSSKAAVYSGGETGHRWPDPVAS